MRFPPTTTLILLLFSLTGALCASLHPRDDEKAIDDQNKNGDAPANTPAGGDDAGDSGDDGGGLNERDLYARDAYAGGAYADNFDDGEIYIREE